MKALIPFVTTLASWSALAAAESPSMDALAAYYTSKGSPPHVEKAQKTVELCLDVCEFYRFRKAVGDAASWDVVFLHQYYYVMPEFNGFEDFHEKYSSLAERLLSKYASLCPGVPSDGRPRCILEKLAGQQQVRGAFVRYDEGYRCEAERHLTDSKYLGKSRCRKLKNAS